MKNSELDKLLKSASEPERSPAYWEAFPRTIKARLSWEPAATPLRQTRPSLAWGLGLLAACAVLAFVIGHRVERMETGNLAKTDAVASLKLIRETLAMFPHHLRAIVQDERGLNLVLSDDYVPVSSPLYVHICDGQHCSSFVTFSGQEIQVAGQTITVLSDARGGVILTGDRFVWSSTEGAPAGHLKIEARNLGTVTL
jgi:hypothetical protein